MTAPSVTQDDLVVLLWSAIQKHNAATKATATHAFASPQTIQELFSGMIGEPYSGGSSYPVMKCCGVFVVPRRNIPPNTFDLEVAP